MAVGTTRATYGDGRPCPGTVWSSALQGLPSEPTTVEQACTTASQERLFSVAVGVLGLVLVSGLLSRRG